MELAKCPKCDGGMLLPLSDTSFETPRVALAYKIWACSNCEYEIGLRSGQVQRGVQIKKEPH